MGRKGAVALVIAGTLLVAVPPALALGPYLLLGHLSDETVVVHLHWSMLWNCVAVCLVLGLVLLTWGIRAVLRPL